MQGGVTGVVTPLNLSEVKFSGSTFGSCTTVTAQFSSFVHQIVATRCQILRLKCTKFDFGWGSAPDPAGGAYSAPPDPLAGFKGAYF